MAGVFKDIDVKRLNELAWEYIQECENATVEVPTTKGACKLKQRKIPTVKYFLYIWLRQKDFTFYSRANWYIILNSDDHPLHDHVKAISEGFASLAIDVIANEGKGIFYAKNALGMADKIERKEERTITSLDIKVVRAELSQPTNLIEDETGSRHSG